MKKCSKCKEVKLKTEFHFKNQKQNLRKTICKSCMSIYFANYYKNSEKRRNDLKIIRSNRIDRNTNLINRHKAFCGCDKCGDKRYYVLDYHHINKKNKDMSVSKMRAEGRGYDRLKKEIRKCKILCSNCHREEHYLNYLFSIK